MSIRLVTNNNKRGTELRSLLYTISRAGERLSREREFDTLYGASSNFEFEFGHYANRIWPESEHSLRGHSSGNGAREARLRRLGWCPQKWCEREAIA